MYHIILTASWEKIYIFRIGLRRFATPPNTEYIFSQLAVNIMWYCRLKIAISLYYHKESDTELPELWSGRVSRFGTTSFRLFPGKKNGAIFLSKEKPWERGWAWYFTCRVSNLIALIHRDRMLKKKML